MSAPPLRRQDIEEKLDRLFAHARGRHLFAFHGTGSEDHILHARAGAVDVIPVESELDLRARLPPFGSEQVTVFLVPWTGRLPIDIGGRFHHNGAIEHIGKSEQLKRLFGVSAIDDAARASPLALHLLRPDAAPHRPHGQGRLTHDAMWLAWLEHDWGWPVEGGLALDALLGFAALDERGPALTAALREAGSEAVLDALGEHLRARIGPAGPVVLRAWSEASARKLLELSLLFATLVTEDDPAARMWTKLQVRGELGIEPPEEAARIARALGEAAPRALRYIAARSAPREVRSLVEAADRRLDDDDLRRLLLHDPRLPTGWALRLDRLGELLAQAAERPSAEGVRELDRARRELEAHALSRDADKLPVQRRAEMACRLAAWLAATPEAWPEPAMTAHGDVEILATWYAKEGGFVDWARRGARGAAEDAFGRGAQAVLDRVAARRRALDHRFARALAAWHDAGQPSHPVVPIHRAVRRIAVPFLKQHEERRLLVLLLDGMAWAQAVEILTDLGSRPTLWGPLAWHQTEGRIGESLYPPVIAAVPTITKVSRSAFFAGKEMKPHADPASHDDVDRWAKNADLAPFCAPGQAPRLQLRAESHTADGSASSAALQLVGDTSQRIVAIVINAIDASLKGDTQQRATWTADTIGSLADLLDRAREAGRTVLLCSDHGHVPADDLVTRTATAGGGGRWRPVEPDEALQPYEVRFRGAHVWLPPGRHEAVALIADDTARYGGGAPAGDHGGAALAEVVAPCVLIGHDDPLTDDPARTVRPLAAPPWWHLDVIAPRTLPSERPKRRPSKPALTPQLTLPNVAPAPAPIESDASARAPQAGDGWAGDGWASHAALASLAASALFRKRVELAGGKRDEVLRAVAYLIERQNAAPGEAFAAALGQHASRVAGFVARLGEVLNVDGYPVIGFDYTSRQVRLDRAKLALLFEVAL